RWQSPLPPTGAVAAASRMTGSARSNQAASRNPAERNGAGSSAMTSHLPKSPANDTSTGAVFGGGGEVEISANATSTASIRVSSQRGAQSASLRSSIASTGRSPSSSQPTSRGMNDASSAVYTSCSRRNQAARFSSVADLTKTLRPS